MAMQPSVGLVALCQILDVAGIYAISVLNRFKYCERPINNFLTIEYVMKISDLEVRIRYQINKTRKQYFLFKDSKGWNQLCSALDIIGDTELALTS